jgi:hypothetical protein
LGTAGTVDEPPFFPAFFRATRVPPDFLLLISHLPQSNVTRVHSHSKFVITSDLRF